MLNKKKLSQKINLNNHIGQRLSKSLLPDSSLDVPNSVYSKSNY